MKIKTTYDVGYEFYVPRVYERWEKETVQLPDSKGVMQTYSRDVSYLDATTKRKRVEFIEITVDTDIKVVYWCCNVGQQDLMATICNECDMNIIDEDTALVLARKWRDEQQTPYYGSTKV